MKLDGELQQAVLDELDWDPRVNAAHIGVAAKEGIVTLAGHVESYAEKRAAIKAAKRVRGVRAVVDDIEVVLPISTRQTNEDLAAAAVGALEAWPIIPSDRIKVSVNNGWITLEGAVNWGFQRWFAERAVRDLPGVVGVTNLITVRPDVSPRKLKSKIEEALKRNAELDAERIMVEVDGDTVILRGRVRSWAEKEEAERIAWTGKGVARVDNRIEVAP